MYYVLQVISGMETRAEIYIMRVLSDNIYRECFHLTRHVKKKYQGKWKDVYEKLLPGYIFIVTENIDKLYLELQKVPMFTKILGRDKAFFSELSKEEVEWIKKVVGDSQKEVGLSMISVEEGNQIQVISGPLKNMEGMIKKVNLHKRIAEVEVKFMGRRIVLYLGIEMLERV